MKTLLATLGLLVALTGCQSLSKNTLPNHDCPKPKANGEFVNSYCLIEGVASAESSKQQGKRGFVNANGDWVIPPIYDYTFDAREGFVIVVKEFDDGKSIYSTYEFLSTTGKPLNNEKYDDAYQFYNGFARVANDKELYAYMDKQGKLITPFKYEWAEDFKGTFVVVRIGEKWGLIDKTGKEVLPIEYDWVHDGRGKSGAERYLVCKKVAENSDAKKCGFMDNHLNLVIPMQYDEALHFGRGNVAWVRQGDKEFYIDENGKKAVLTTLGSKALDKVLFK